MQQQAVGSRLSICSQCGGAIEQGDAFCGACGARLVDAPPASQHQEGSRGVPPAASVTQSYEAEERRGSVAPRPLLTQDMLSRVSANGWILSGAAVAIVIASLLPWVAVSADGIGISSSPPSNAPIVLMTLAAAALAVGWPVIRGKLSKRRLVGLAVVAGVLSIFVVTNWTDLSNLEQQAKSAQSVVQVSVSAGSGLFLYTAGVVAMWVCVVRVFLVSRRH